MKQGWTYKKLGEVCNIICGQDYKSVVDPNGKYPIYGSGGIMGYASQCRCPAFSVIIGRKGNINTPLFVETDFWNVDTAFGVVANKDILVPKFLFYFADNYDFTRHDVSVTIPSLRRTDLLKIFIPIPPISEQKRIVSELDILSSIIEKKNEQLKAYDQLAQSIFYDMFGDPIENPKGWEVKKLGEVCEVTSSKRVYQSEWQTSGVPFYRISDFALLVDNAEIHSDLFISYEKYDELMKCNQVPKFGDVLVTSRGTLGTCYIVKNDDRFYFQDGMISWLKNIDKQVCPLFVVFLFKNDSFRQQINKNQSGSTVSYLSISMIKRFILPLPPLSLQQSFAEKIESIEHQKSLIQQSIVEVQTMFDYTMDKYFG